MSTINSNQPIAAQTTAVGSNPRKVAKIILEVVTVLLFLLFMVPFLMVILNSAKTSKEIIFNAVAMPTNWVAIIVARNSGWSASMLFASGVSTRSVSTRRMTSAASGSVTT